MAPFESREDRIADLLADRYELLELFGQGGFAAVYKVKNLRLGRIEALKVLSQEMTEDGDFAGRFEQEARVSASLDHPNIVKIYDYGVAEGIAWFSMQFINGQSLARELSAGTGRMEEAETLRIALLILDALEYSHSRGVIHRDIKPDNIMMDASRRPYLADFGIAKAEGSLVKTRSGLLIGSPAYMAPEQISGGTADGRTDLYALAVTLYKMLTGGFPFASGDALRLAMKKLQEPPEPLRQKRSDLKVELEAVVMKALARDPAERFESASGMREALEACIGDIGPRERLLRGSRSAPFVSRAAGAPEFDPTIPTAPDSIGTSARTTPHATTVQHLTGAVDGWRRRRRWAVVGLVLVLATASGWALLRRWSNSTSAAASTVHLQVTVSAGEARAFPTPETDKARAMPTVAPAAPSQPEVVQELKRNPSEEGARKEAARRAPEKKSEAVKAANLMPRRLPTSPALSKPAAGNVLYCATIAPTAYVQGTAKELPSGFSKEQGEVGRAPRPDAARIQIEVSVRPSEPHEDEPFEILARLVNGGDMDLTVSHVEESAVRVRGGFQPTGEIPLPTTTGVGGAVTIYTYRGALRGGGTYFKELRVTDSLGDSWKTSVRLMPCPPR